MVCVCHAICYTFSTSFIGAILVFVGGGGGGLLISLL